MRIELKSYRVVSRDDLLSSAKRAYIDLEKSVVIDRHDVFKYDFYDVPNEDKYYAVVSNRAIRAAHQLHFTVERFGKNRPVNADEIIDKLNEVIDRLALCTEREVENLWHGYENGGVIWVPEPVYKKN